MAIKQLYNTITHELEKEAINKFESKEEYTNWNQKVYEEHGFKAYGLKVPEINKIIKKYLTQFKELSFEERINLSQIFL
ncbi:MAG: hypothetical protein ACFFB0_19065 [Promethearchaeota archaeon]